MDNIKTKHLEDLNNGIVLVEKHIPKLEEMLDGKIIRLEGKNTEISNALDDFAGCDYLLIKDNQIYGISMRIQVSDYDYATFTIRGSRQSGSKTEIDKRRQNIQDDAIYPKYIVQMYVDSDNEIISIGIGKTKDVIEHINLGYADNNIRYNSQDNNLFYVIRWSTIDNHFKPVFDNILVYRKENNKI